MKAVWRRCGVHSCTRLWRTPSHNRFYGRRFSVFVAAPTPRRSYYNGLLAHREPMEVVFHHGDLNQEFDGAEGFWISYLIATAQ